MVLVLGVAAAVSVAGILLLVREIVIRSHVGRLEEDPSHFEELLRRSDGFAVREALERYVGTDGGRRAFVRALLALGVGEDLEKWFNRRKLGDRALIRLTESAASRVRLDASRSFAYNGAVDFEDEPWTEEAEWACLTPRQRFEFTLRLWEFYIAAGGSLEPEPDSQSPFDFPEMRSPVAPHGRAGVHPLRRG